MILYKKWLRFSEWRNVLGLQRLLVVFRRSYLLHILYSPAIETLWSVQYFYIARISIGDLDRVNIDFLSLSHSST